MKANRTFLVYFLSYLIVIIVPVVCIGIFSYQLAIRTLEEELSQANAHLLNQQSQSLNKIVRDLHALSVTAGLDGKVYAYAQNAGDPYLLNEMKDAVKTWAGSNELIQSVHLFAAQTGAVISSDGMASISLQSGQENVLEKLRSTGKKELWIPTRQMMDRDGNQVSIITLIGKIPLAFPEELGYVAVHIYEEKLSRMLESMEGNPHTNTYIAAADGSLISSRIQERSDYVTLLTHVAGIPDSGEEHYYVDKSRGAPTLENGWMLVSETPMTYLIRKLSYIRNVTVAVCLLLIALGAILSYFLSKSMYLPFKRLMSRSLSLEASFRTNLPAIRERFVSNLLNNKIASRTEIQSSLSFLNLSLTLNGYVVMLIEIDDYPALERTYSTSDLNLYKFAIGNIAEEIIGESFGCLSTERQANQCAVLVNVQDTPPDEVRAILQTYAEQVSAAILNILKFSVTISAGSRYECMEDAYLSYNEAAEVIQYKLVLGTNKVIFSEDVRLERGGIDYYYPLQMEKHLINFLKNGDGPAAAASLEQLTEEVKQNPRLTYENIYRLYNRLLDAVLEALLERGGSVGQVFGEGVFLYRELAGMETIDAIHEWLERVLTRIAAFAAEQETMTNPTVDKALAYMQHNFRSDLSLEAIADSVGLNPAYFSRIFKQYMGKTVVEHLTQLRLEESKALLGGSTMNIHDIARSVGYNNTNSYIRFFKKLEGITPGEYRKQIDRRRL